MSAGWAPEKYGAVKQNHQMYAQLLTVKLISESRIEIFDALYGHFVVLNCWLEFSRNR